LSTGDVRVRPALPSDDAELLRIDAETCSPDNAPGERPDPGPGESFFDAAHPPEEVLVADIGGTAVGYVRIRPPTRLPTNSHVLLIAGLAVAPEHGRRGIGRLLLDAAAEHAGSMGATRLRLRVFSTNPGARRLYEAAGFEVEGVLRGEFVIAGRQVDDVLMARTLGAQRPGRLDA
jgi:ribosomal protein S18 acetylase RimI-like enzyme